MNHTAELKKFYNHQALKFSETRKKTWPEFPFIVKEIESHYKKKVKILELGCGDGRLVGYLREHCSKSFTYTGIDLSNKLIDIALTNYSQEHFEVSEMWEFLEQSEQEHYDIIIAVASFQHLSDKKSRLLVLHHCYKTLDYDGKLIMINRSFSKRFFDKFWKPIIESLRKSLYSLGLHTFNDILVPWKSHGTIFYRYYHIFLLSEIKELFRLTGFIKKQASYITSDGIMTDHRLRSRNTWFVAEKNVLK